MLEKAIDEQDLDHRLAGPYQISGPTEEDAGSSLLPIYVHELFDVFPHWGDRLYSILQEVAEPTPMSWHEKWSDRRKSPRYMYWAGALALMLAFLFGNFATVLGALQVWISYCSWKGPSAGWACQTKSASAAPIAPGR